MQRSGFALTFTLVGGMALAVLAVPAHATGRHGFPHTLLAFHSMYGVDGPFLGYANAVRCGPGDDLPWDPPKVANGVLTTDGRLFIAVRGLVLGEDDVVPPDQRGINPDDTFRGLVSCLTEDGDAVKEANVQTQPFKADAQGNS